jgi:hypothetical protein
LADESPAKNRLPNGRERGKSSGHRRPVSGPAITFPNFFAMKKAPYVELKKFLGAVFHPDWTIQNESADHAVKKFARKAEDKVRKAILGDIHHLLTERTDEDLENFVCEDARGDIFPPALGFTYSDWLRHVGELLSAGAGRKSAAPAAKKATAAARKKK